ncbi:ZnF_C2H2 [Nesidiocoris tenuis]|uniref:ZnF_C2H2 n=1 Tax=Nesidiocoris tenuis TaxID=355587 RepID=A0ABN7A5G2_9HEMI|nr:ZnF_C2H2 [Nesidiocoris tenuis]
MGKPKTYRREDLVFCCEWNDCWHESTEEEEFYKHVSNHIPEIPVEQDPDMNNEHYQCSWKHCQHSSDSSSEIVRHVKYHSYLTMLKAKGALVAANKELPPCNYSESEGNAAVPPWTDTYVCQWDGCTFETPGIREHIGHVSLHVGGVENSPFCCAWKGCSFSTPKVKGKLLEHVKKHTGERIIACHVCGNTFANTTKFSDHFVRQKNSIDESFKCAYCFTYLPNERIYRDHMRQHVHHHKCCYCDLTCVSASVLVQHIRYRHLPYRPFQCSFCKHACKSNLDLKDHLLSHSKDVSHYSCSVEDCDFKCKRHSVLIRHIYKVHGDGTIKDAALYVCHLCDKKFTTGARLTRHLSRVHEIRKPAGYSRFIYRQEDDGCFRLRTVRLESLEVMETDDVEKIQNQTIETAIQAVIEMVDEEGHVISSNTSVMEAETLPPDAKIVAICEETDP